MSPPRSSEAPNLCDGAESEGEACSDGYPDDYQYSSSGDAETDANSSSELRREPDFTALGDAGGHMPRDHALQAPRETAWTDDLHRLYLDLIEEAFVRSLYQDAACCCYGNFHWYTPGRGRCRPPEDIECVCSGESDDNEEEVESNAYEPERRIEGATALALPVSDCQERHGMDCHDGITDGGYPRKILGVFSESWTSGHAGGLAEEEYGSRGGSLQETLVSGVKEDPTSKMTRNMMAMVEIGEKLYTIYRSVFLREN